MKLPIVVALLGLACSPPLLAQSPCTDYHKFNCPQAGDKRFSTNGQSKSAAVQVGTPTELVFIAYRGQDYRITVCSDPRVLGEQVAIRLLEKVRVPKDVEGTVITTEPILDEKGRPTGAVREVRTKGQRREFEEVVKVLWDNTAHDMVQEVEFSCTATKRLAIEVTAPGNPDGKGKRDKQGFDIGCMGILIEHMPSPGLGF
jgi:hypothetical protein